MLVRARHVTRFNQVASKLGSRLAASFTKPLQDYQENALFMAAYFNTWIVTLLAVSIDCFCNVKTQKYKESEFLDAGQIASGDLSGQTDARTTVRISIMIQ